MDQRRFCQLVERKPEKIVIDIRSKPHAREIANPFKIAITVASGPDCRLGLVETICLVLVEIVDQHFAVEFLNDEVVVTAQRVSIFMHTQHTP